VATPEEAALAADCAPLGVDVALPVRLGRALLPHPHLVLSRHPQTDNLSDSKIIQVSDGEKLQAQEHAELCRRTLEGTHR
jgi:hypothetical protein